MPTIDLARRYKLPKFIGAAARKGLAYHEAGFSGDGLQPQTLREARSAASGDGWTEDKIRRARAWFARHESSLISKSFDADKPRPSGVAWLLWGSDPADGDKGRKWLEQRAAEFEDVEVSMNRHSTDKKKKKKGYSQNRESESLGYASEHVAKQAEAMPSGDTMRHTVSPGIDVIIGEDDTVYAVIADAEKHSAEDFAAWLKDNAYKADLDEGDGSEREEGGKVYRLDDGSDRAAPAELSKPLFGDTAEFYLMDDDSKDLHVLRAGPLYDLDGGEQVMDLSESQLEEIALTTQKIIDAGHALPVSFEHGIEAGFRGVPTADRRPYGEILSVYYDQDKKSMYAKKRWTKLGREVVEASIVDGDKSALRVSPRIRFSPAHHPKTGEVLGESGYVDVVSITTLPRQAEVERVALNRATITDQEEKQEKTNNLIQLDQTPAKIETGIDSLTGTTGEGIAEPSGHGQKGCNMADKKQAEIEQADVLLGRGTEEANRIIKAVGLGQDVDGVELARHVETMTTKIEEMGVELGRYKAEADARELARKEAEADALLDSTELQGVEREFYRSALLGGDDAASEFARKAIEERGKPDHMVKINEALDAAKQRGALAADFALTAETAELARENSDVVVKLFEAIPAGMVVRVGEAAGSDSAGLEVKVATELDATQAEAELSRLAKKIFREGKAETRVQAWELARKERGDLDAVVNGE